MPAPARFWRWFFDRESPAWQRRAADPAIRARIEAAADRLSGALSGGPGPVVDLGCGTGDIAVAVRARGASVVGLDAASGMVIRSLAAGVPVVRADLSRPLPLRSEYASGVLANFVIQFLPDPAAFLAEIRRVLAPGAPLLIGLPYRGWHPPPRRELRRLRGRVYWYLRQTASCAPGMIHRFGEDEVCTLMVDGGFRIEDTRPLPSGGVSILASRVPTGYST